MTITTTTVLTTYQKETDTGIPKIDNKIQKKTEKDIPHYEKYKFLFWEFETPVIWTSVFFITAWHVLAVYLFVTHDFTHYGIIIYCKYISYSIV